MASKKEPGRHFEATQETTIREIQFVMKQIKASSLRIEQDILSNYVKVIFDRAGKRYVRECTRWPNALDNLRAIGLQIEYLWRALESLGVNSSESSFDHEFDIIFGGFFPAPDDTALLIGDGRAPWWEVLGVKPEATKAEIRSAYRALARVHMPDAGGDTEAAKILNTAYHTGIDQAKK